MYLKLCNYHKIAKFHKYQPQGGLNHLPVKFKTVKQKGVSHTNLL